MHSILHVSPEGGEGQNAKSYANVRCARARLLKSGREKPAPNQLCFLMKGDITADSDNAADRLSVLPLSQLLHATFRNKPVQWFPENSYKGDLGHCVQFRDQVNLGRLFGGHYGLEAHQNEFLRDLLITSNKMLRG